MVTNEALCSDWKRKSPPLALRFSLEYWTQQSNKARGRGRSKTKYWIFAWISLVSSIWRSIHPDSGIHYDQNSLHSTIIWNQFLMRCSQNILNEIKINENKMDCWNVWKQNSRHIRYRQTKNFGSFAPAADLEIVERHYYWICQIIGKISFPLSKAVWQMP